VGEPRPRLWTALRWTIPATPPLEAIQACRDRLDQKGVDRGSVTVRSTAADLVHLRRSLGIDAWHLHGVSSGTRIALELLRIDGSSVASAVLDSPTPPEVDLYDDLPEGVLYALTSMENLCRADATCPGGLVGPLRSVLDDLADRPVAVTIWSGEASAYDDARLIRLVADALAAPAGLNVVDGAVALAPRAVWPKRSLPLPRWRQPGDRSVIRPARAPDSPPNAPTSFRSTTPTRC